MTRKKKEEGINKEVTPEALAEHTGTTVDEVKEAEASSTKTGQEQNKPLPRLYFEKTDDAKKALYDKTYGFIPREALYRNVSELVRENLVKTEDRQEDNKPVVIIDKKVLEMACTRFKAWQETQPVDKNEALSFLESIEYKLRTYEDRNHDLDLGRDELLGPVHSFLRRACLSRDKTDFRPAIEMLIEARTKIEKRTTAFLSASSHQKLDQIREVLGDEDADLIKTEEARIIAAENLENEGDQRRAFVTIDYELSEMLSLSVPSTRQSFNAPRQGGRNDHRTPSFDRQRNRKGGRRDNRGRDRQ